MGTGNKGVAVVSPAASSVSDADEEDAAPGAGKELVASGPLAPPSLLLRPRVAG